MKIIGKFKARIIDQKNHAHLNFIVENYQNVMQLEELKEDECYSLDIKKRKSARSINQNKFLWALLHALEIKTRETAMSWYIKALMDTGAKFDYIWATVKTEDSLKQQFRAIQRIKPHRIKESDGWLYKVFIGSSKFNVEEMNKLLDTVMRYCHNWEIDIEEYRDIE